MMPPNLPDDPNLLEIVLQPLLEDFQYWFARSRSLLESERLEFLSVAEQDDLLQRVTSAQHELNSAQSLFLAMDAKVGVSMATIVPWHQLVTECWSVAMRYRKLKAEPTSDSNTS